MQFNAIGTQCDCSAMRYAMQRNAMRRREEEGGGARREGGGMRGGGMEGRKGQEEGPFPSPSAAPHHIDNVDARIVSIHLPSRERDSNSMRTYFMIL